jgi:cellulose synthase/poly-beta-1,6-N-acetylglucosamine synthase-like glycosyltransferase/spore germination protein YaaH/peptidoglycan/xylan/chitin deacetylase (PgdA/CDA1 family)
MVAKQSKPIFYDEKRRRWFFTRRAMEISGAVVTLLLLTFFVSIIRTVSLPSLILQNTIAVRRPVLVKTPPKKTTGRPGRRHRVAALGQVVTNPDPLRAAFYIDSDARALASLKMHYKDLDLIFPEEVHVISADGLVDVMDSSDHEHPHLGADEAARINAASRLHSWMLSANVEIQVMALVNNIDEEGEIWNAKELSQLLANPAARKKLEGTLVTYLLQMHEQGMCLDFEDLAVKDQPHFRAFSAELATELHAKALKLMIALPALDPDYDYAFLGKQADAIALMNYDEHWKTSAPGPIASQAWFQRNLDALVKVVPPAKIIMAISNYGYDWEETQKAGEPAQDMSVQDALLTASESDAQVEFDSDSLNPHFSYYDEHNHVHQVWFTDAVTAYNQMRASERAGVRGTVLWRLGMADASIWYVWDTSQPDDAARSKLGDMPPGPDLILEGSGDIWRILDTPQNGQRTFRYDSASDTIQDEAIQKTPLAWHIEEMGAAPHKLALTFDDGPDDSWTPQILDILRDKKVPATFFVIGENANRYPQILDREFKEGHEIGNHTYTHEPFVEGVPTSRLQWELNLTERLIEAQLGVKTVFFRPPFGIDHQPETSDEVSVLPIAQGMGYMLVGARIDPHDWGDVGGGAPPAASLIVQRTLADASTGSIIMMHDGGGDRSQTVAALPQVIDGLRAAGYEIVPVSELVNQTRTQVMPQVTGRELWAARADAFIFGLLFMFRVGIAAVFIFGILLVSGRAIIIGLLALAEKLRAAPGDHRDFKPRVSILIPAYNEEDVIVQTVTSALAADYPNKEILVVDDGSTDRTGDLLDEHFGGDPRVRIFHQVNRGKPAALALMLEAATSPIIITIDADTSIEPQAIGKLVRNFADSNVGAVAGNVKVGNRTRWLTRWQALEYITSQNMEKRAFDLLNCVPVVPGAVGAWRVEAMRAAGGFSAQTVAEDTDLTIAIRRAGWRICYDEEAIGYTQAPETAGALIRQRFRWTFGTLQSVWKHRDTVGRWRYGTLGWIAIPNIFLFQLMLPLFSPVIDLLFLLSLAFWGLAQFRVMQLPQLWTSQDIVQSVVFFLGFMLIDLLACVIAFLLEKKEDWSLLLPLILQRFYYRQMMYFVLFRALTQAVKGRPVGWRGVEPEPPKPATPSPAVEPSLSTRGGD